MKTFKASQELVDIFFKNGLVDITKKYHPDHVERLRNEGYDPNLVKRRFGFENRRPNIYLDYIQIYSVFQNGMSSAGTAIDENALRSLLTFHRITVVDRANWMKKNRQSLGNEFDLYKQFEHPNIYNSASDKRIKQTFDSIIID